MKKVITLLFLCTACIVNAQAFLGKSDIKAQVGANVQNGGTGIAISADFGLGPNMSYGFAASYMLSANKIVREDMSVEKPEFGDRIDAKVRFSAHLGNVFKLDKKMDIYPGLNLGVRNFGGHLGFRYFFTDGLGIFTEAGIPIAKYNTSPSGFDYYNNQFVFTAGLSFNL